MSREGIEVEAAKPERKNGAQTITAGAVLSAPAPADPTTPVKQVAIVAYAASTREMYRPLDSSWERWGLNRLYEIEDVKGFSRWYETHDRDLFPQAFPPEHLAWLRAQHIPLYMADAYLDIPAAVRFPRERLMEKFGRYFTSSMAWMLALAIDEGYQRIRLYGMDLMGDSEYEVQRSCIEYLIGLARGLGREVWLPPQCALLRASHLYGFEPVPQIGAIDTPYLLLEIKEWSEKLEQLMQNAQMVLGQRQMCNKILALIRPHPAFAPVVERLEVEAATLATAADKLLAQASAAEGSKAAYERQLNLVAHWRKWGVTPGLLDTGVVR